MAISVGSAAIDRTTGLGASNRTWINLNGAANASGSIGSFEIFFVAGNNPTGVKIGTFYGSGTDYTSRDSATIGNVTSGAKQTFSGLNVSIQTGDFAGFYAATTSSIEEDDLGSNACFVTGDKFGAGLTTYTNRAGGQLSLYGYSAPTTNIKSIFGLAYASVKSVNGLAIASVKSFNGLT